MPTSPEPTSSTATRQIRPPPLSQHLASSLLISYLEIWPERALGAVFGAPSRLWEYDPGDPQQTGDYHDLSRGASFRCDSVWSLLAGSRMFSGNQRSP